MNSSTVSKVEETEIIQYMNNEVQTKSKQQQCQVPVFNGKKSQADENSNMQLKKPVKDMWSNGPVIQHKMSKKHMPREDDKNCQINRRPLKSKMCSDKKCQENIDMWPVKPQMEVQLKKPAKVQSSYKKRIN